MNPMNEYAPSDDVQTNLRIIRILEDRIDIWVRNTKSAQRNLDLAILAKQRFVNSLARREVK